MSQAFALAGVAAVALAAGGLHRPGWWLAWGMAAGGHRPGGADRVLPGARGRHHGRGRAAGRDVGANAAYGLASRHGLVSVVAVLASLYPVVTALLARQLLDERLRPVQLVGVTAAIGAALIAAA